MKAATTKQRSSGARDDPQFIMAANPPGDADDRINAIAIAAYFKAEARGFMPGKELDDWLEAEANFKSH